MPRLDDPGMNRPDGHFVDLFPLDAKVVRDPGLHGPGGLAARPWRIPRPVWSMKADRLQPRVAFRRHCPLLGELALKPVGLGTTGRQRRIALFDPGRARGQHPV